MRKADTEIRRRAFSPSPRTCRKGPIPTHWILQLKAAGPGRATRSAAVSGCLESWKRISEETTASPPRRKPSFPFVLFEGHILLFFDEFLELAQVFRGHSRDVSGERRNRQVRRYLKGPLNQIRGNRVFIDLPRDVRREHDRPRPRVLHDEALFRQPIEHGQRRRVSDLLLPADLDMEVTSFHGPFCPKDLHD